MTKEEFEADCMRTAARFLPDPRERSAFFMLALAEECAELQKLVLKAIRHGSPIDTAALREEAGDVLNVLCVTLADSGLSLEAAMVGDIDKRKRRGF